MAVWTFVRLSLREASRSRLLPLALLLTGLYVGLVAWGMSKLAANQANLLEAVAAGAGLEIMAFFVGSFMLALLAVFVAGHSTHQDAESGLLQAILTKPVRRFDLMLGRWLASALLMLAWVAVFTAGIVYAVGSQIGYYPPHPVLAALLLFLQAAIVLSLRMFFGTFLGTLASGIVPLLLYGLGWMGGMVETVGNALHIQSLVNGGIVTSLLVPTDAVWRGASFFLLPEASAFTGALGGRNPAGGLPVVGLAPIAAPMVIWAAAYTLLLFLIGVRLFARRDI
ncbi:MAG: ABC transporter permease [Chloroflexi bacterium]|nr:ABC transporter permease [Chloroflexota bacterium]